MDNELKINIEINFNQDFWDFDIWVNGEEIVCGTRDTFEEITQAIKQNILEKRNIKVDELIFDESKFVG